MQNSIPETGLSGVSIDLIKSVYLLTTSTKCTIICIFSANCSVHEKGLLVHIFCVKNRAHNHPENFPGNHCMQA